ncbi:hypothetical protein Bphyt_0027 [Paraburkholderia phytofirmans PsJN]|uniref:Uncharacterized protein n=1 Tax=Paraburkholderia phytofirmans (strain DSM 17436 / LMG 22146 / PsJN) TaxID=398527 RepID=B2SZA0_PARPJ|nr:hypothetical protein Bphyt_0027 [Paraburkholderia phytofirmans PsJN]
MTVGGRVAVADVSVVVIVRMVAMTAGRAVVGMRVRFVPVHRDFRLFEAIGVGVVGLRHGGFLVRFVV